MVRRGAIILCLLQLACNGDTPVAPTPPQTTLPAPPAPVTVRGRVLDSTTDAPVPGASVVLRRDDGLSVAELTDAAGSFVFTNVVSRQVTIRAGKTAYDAAEQQVALIGDVSIDIAIAPRKHTLSGRVTDVTTGAPLPATTLTVIDGLNASRSTTTGDDGTYVPGELWFGGFTLRVRKPGYDAVFRGVPFAGDTTLDIQMRVAQHSLSGTWTGDITYTSRGPLAIAEATLTHSGATIASNFPAAAFTGTLANPSAIGSTTQVTGTLTVRRTTGNPRNPIPCDGTGSFTGTVNWTRLVVTAPQVTYSCGGSDSVTLSLLRQQ
ncbi:MAG: carboxypeptidase regulatory-like domain-containing protein [Acidobacteria bacterium]|nr:carboxypeptidase regulatory-like domain-containing protein [Acidobacteriota bacterium]